MVIAAILSIWILFGNITMFLYVILFDEVKDWKEENLPSVFVLWFIFIIPLFIRVVYKLMKNTYKSTGNTCRQIFSKPKKEKYIEEKSDET